MNVKIDFLEYIIITIVICLLYLFTVIELLVKKTKNERENAEEYRFSAQWALLGIMLTLVCGYIVKWNVLEKAIDNRYLLLVPLFFIGQWLYFYSRSSIAVKEFTDIKGQVLETYRPVLVQTLIEIREGSNINEDVSFIDDEGYASEEALLYLVELNLKRLGKHEPFEHQIAVLLDKISKTARKNINNKGFNIVFDMVKFDHQKLSILLGWLKKERRIEIKPHASYYVLYRIAS